MSDDEYQVTIARYGARETRRSDVFLNYHLYGQPDAPVGMDYFVWVARNAARTVVIDTGFSPHGGAVRNRTSLMPVPELFRRAGVDPATAPTVVVTHAHYDHIGNLELFPASPIVLAKQEYEFWSGPHGHHVLFHHAVEDDELAAVRKLVSDGQVRLFTGRREIAPGIEAIEVGGHTPGQSVVKVNTSAGVVLLASDAVHYYDEYEHAMPFSSVADLVAMYQAFDTVRAMLASGEVAHLVSGHDPSTMERFDPGTGELAGHAATIGSL